MGGLFRPNLSNLRQSAGRYRLEDVLVYDSSLTQGKLIIDRVFDYRESQDVPLSKDSIKGRRNYAGDKKPAVSTPDPASGR